MLGIQGQLYKRIIRFHKYVNHPQFLFFSIINPKIIKFLHNQRINQVINKLYVSFALVHDILLIYQAKDMASFDLHCLHTNFPSRYYYFITFRYSYDELNVKANV